MAKINLKDSFNIFLESLSNKLKPSTIRAYRTGLNALSNSLINQGIDPKQTHLSEVSIGWIYFLLQDMSELAISTKHVYLQSVVSWYEFLANALNISIDTEELRKIAQPTVSKESLPTDRASLDFEISRIIDYASDLDVSQTKDEKERLRLLRDRALILILADTGLAIETICSLERRNINWREKQLENINEGSLELTGITPRVQEALQTYLDERHKIDVAAEKEINTLPVFTRHDPGAGKKILGISSTTVRNTINNYVRITLGQDFVGIITPRSFRNYYVLNNLHKSFELFHPKIVKRSLELYISGRYDEAIFNSLKVVEEEIREKISGKPNDIGVPLVTKAMASAAPLIEFSPVQAEQESTYFLFRGAIGLLKNPQSHRFIDTTDPLKAFECIATASLLMRQLDEIDDQ